MAIVVGLQCQSAPREACDAASRAISRLQYTADISGRFLSKLVKSWTSFPMAKTATTVPGSGRDCPYQPIQNMPSLRNPCYCTL